MADRGSSLRKSCNKQRQELTGFNDAALKLGDTWYLVDAHWFKQWKCFVGYDGLDESMFAEESACPGPIDNSPLLKGDVLKDHLVEDSNFILVPQHAWNCLVEWYGLKEGQEPIGRNVIQQGAFNKNLKIEIYLTNLVLCRFRPNDTATITLCFSHADTLENVVNAMRAKFNIDNDTEVRLWHKYSSKACDPLTKLDSTILDAGLYSGHVIMIEEQNDDGTWPMQSKYHIGSSVPLSALGGASSPSLPGPRSSNSGSEHGRGNNFDTLKFVAQPGLCGLSNLGNTCFMNSAIQCMSNVPPLTDYMLSEAWKQDLNRDNPLGMHGDIACTYAELIRNMWTGKYSLTVPRQFKIAVGRFKPEFSGYQQQDSQELMAFLLDGLHEDLNRIQKKPYVETKDSDNRPDQEVAAETWQDYNRRNDSVIVDTFHGLLKSTLVCPQCAKISIKFDPFCYLSVPLPVKKERQIEVYFVPLDSALRAVKYKLTVPKMGTISDLCLALSSLNKVACDYMIVTDVYNHRFHKVFAPHELLSQIVDHDYIYVYQTPVRSLDDPDIVMVPVYMREIKEKQGTLSVGSAHTQLFGLPLLVPVPRHTCVFSVLYDSVLKSMKRYVHPPVGNECPSSQVDPAMSVRESEHGDTESDNVAQAATSPTSHQKLRSRPGESSVGHRSMRSLKGAELTESSPVNQHLFSFCIVSSYGNTDIERVKEDGQPIRFNHHAYFSADWTTKNKEAFYDDKETEMCDSDDSVEEKIAPKKVIHLTDCLELFTTEERLGEQDPWYCPLCKKHQQATKKFDIWRLPHILVFHLKRFSYNRHWRDKLDTFVDYPTRGLDMSRFVIGPISPSAGIYDLIAVSNHFGGMGGGHYTAYAKNKNCGQWFNFDDSSVTMTSEQSVVTKAGYVLVYQQRDTAKKVDGQKNCYSLLTYPSTFPSTNHSVPETLDSAMSQKDNSTEISMDLN